MSKSQTQGAQADLNSVLRASSFRADFCVGSLCR